MGAARAVELPPIGQDRPASTGEDPGDAVAASDPAGAEGAPNAWPDESAEAAIMSELRTRGEVATPGAVEAVEETDTRDLPPLDALVQRIPADVRETVDDLFRAKFVRVVRVPKASLKNPA